MAIYTTYVTSRASGTQDVPLEFTHEGIPDGFALGKYNMLDWTAAPRDILMAAGVTTLTGGRYVDANSSGGHVPCLSFNDGKINVRLENRPVVAAAVAWHRQYLDLAEQARCDHWRREHEQREAANKAAVPAGHVYLQFVSSEADGWIDIYRTPEGVDLRNPKLAGGERAGTGRGGWAYATREDVDEAMAVRSREAEKNAAILVERRLKAAEHREKLLAVVVPDYVLKAYVRWGGDSEKADESDSGEQDASLIRNYADAIEVQGLAIPVRAWRAEYASQAEAQSDA